MSQLLRADQWCVNKKEIIMQKIQLNLNNKNFYFEKLFQKNYLTFLSRKSHNT